MVALPGKRATRASAQNFFPRNTRNSASACTKSCGQRANRSGSTFRTTGASIAVTTTAIAGRTLLKAYLQTLASPWSVIPTTLTLLTSCPSNPTNTAARRKASCACTAPGTAAEVGNPSRAACRRKMLSRPCCVTPCPRIRWIPQAFTSARAAESSTDRTTKASPGNFCRKGCRPSCASRPPSWATVRQSRKKGAKVRGKARRRGPRRSRGASDSIPANWWSRASVPGKLTMAVTINIPSYLAAFAEGHRSVKLRSSPTTVSQALEVLWAQHPALRDRVVDEQGQVRQHINIFVGDECIRFAQGLATAVPDGVEIMIVPAVSGGSVPQGGHPHSPVPQGDKENG